MSEGCLFGMAVTLSPVLHNDPNGRGILAYKKLPQQLLRLSVHKLDGSFFDVQVSKTATIAELKEAVEDVFIKLPMIKQVDISWSHVWGHFCLCYNGQKLVNDKTFIRIFGIKDGDQLDFTKHRSVNWELRKIEKRRGMRLPRSLNDYDYDYEEVVPWELTTHETGF